MIDDLLHSPNTPKDDFTRGIRALLRQENKFRRFDLGTILPRPQPDWPCAAEVSNFFADGDEYADPAGLFSPRLCPKEYV
jgi:hypothetical protein